jgi:hypothetical protein
LKRKWKFRLARCSLASTTDAQSPVEFVREDLVGRKKQVKRLEKKKNWKGENHSQKSKGN